MDDSYINVLDRLVGILNPCVFWLPFLAVAAALLCLAIPRLRRFASFVFHVPLWCGFITSASIFPPLFGAGLVLGLGARRGLWLPGLVGAATGVWAGIVVARRVGRLPARWAAGCAILQLYLYYLPLGLLQCFYGGGSGYGWGVPRWYLRVFEVAYLPWVEFVWQSLRRHVSVQLAFVIAFWVVVFFALFHIGRGLYRRTMRWSELPPADAAGSRSPYRSAERNE